MRKNLLLRLEAAGTFIIFILASLLHFAYDLSPNVLTALFGAVNESIWEHIKIFSVAYLFYAFIEYLWARPSLKRFTVAKTVGLLAQGLFIPLVYYTYTLFTKRPVLIVDLLIGFFAAAVGMLVSYRLYKSDRDLEKYFYTALMMLFLALMMILCFSYFPPETKLFRDVVTGTYGVPDKSLDMGAFAIDGAKSIDVF